MSLPALFEQRLGQERKDDFRMILRLKRLAKMVLRPPRLPILLKDQPHQITRLALLGILLQDVFQHHDGGLEVAFLLVLPRLCKQTVDTRGRRIARREQYERKGEDAECTTVLKGIHRISDLAFARSLKCNPAKLISRSLSDLCPPNS